MQQLYLLAAPRAFCNLLAMTMGPHDSEPSGQALTAGNRLEEFVIERVLGSGGFGITYLARDTGLNRQVVIKENLPAQFAWRETTTGTVRPRHTTGGDADDFAWSMNNFLKEAETLASLDHPGIVRVLRKFEANGTAYFVMPFVEGVAFDELIKERRENKQSFSEEELKGLLERMLHALAYLHNRGIYHRDIKPGNILISNEGVPALIDFGSARQRLSERSMTVVESAGYTPFEQMQSRGNVGPWSDLYALGATIEKAITSEAPPKAADRIGSDPRVALVTRQDLARNYSRGLLASVDQALAVDGKKRWQSAVEWQEALAAGRVARPRASATHRSPQAVPVSAREEVGETRMPPVAQSTAWNEETTDEHASQKVMAHGSRSRWGLVAVASGFAVIGIAGWAIKRSGPVGDPSAEVSQRSHADTPDSLEAPTVGRSKSASLFAAATMAPSNWAQMANSGDPLAQALLGDALYWGGQKNHGIEIDPAAGVKWVEKSANAGHPLGHCLMGLLREQDGKWFPRDEEEAKQDYVEAVRLGLLRDAENGGPVWWTALAQVLEQGKGVAADPKTAVMWYRKAAEAGYVDGMNGLANCYDTGAGVAEDDAIAVSWYRKSAESGNSRGMAMLGAAYSFGAGVPKDPSEAVKWYRKAAELGEGEAQVRLGEAYSEGEGVPKDLAEAIKWYQKAADQEHAEGQLLLGTAYEFGDGVAENPSMAAKWYRKASDQGDSEAQCSLGDCYRRGEGVPEDPKEAVKMYRLAAQQGHAFAQNSLGDCYAEGVGVTKDSTTAVEWYRKAAEKGYAVAQNNLGHYYFNGDGEAGNPAEAVRWYRKAAEQGFAIAQANLGFCYAIGSGVGKDAEVALKWYREAAAKDYPRAQFLLGDCYANGEGVSQDYASAVKWYRKAADAGLVSAQNQLGICYYQGNGVPKNAAEAVKWCRLAADQGLASAQNNLGYCYANGEGVVKDQVEAAKWYRKAAEQGHGDAQNELGNCYANGEGMAKNQIEAAKWYQKAAEQEHAAAQFSFGYCYDQGTGVAKNPAEAAKWYEKAAEQGHSIAQNNIGICYADGLGIPKNLVLGYMWTGLAVASGNTKAKENLESISSQMTPVQIAEARKLGREWKAKKEADKR